MNYDGQLTDDNIEFIVFYNNRNIRRKLRQVIS